MVYTLSDKGRFPPSRNAGPAGERCNEKPDGNPTYIQVDSWRLGKEVQSDRTKQATGSAGEYGDSP